MRIERNIYVNATTSLGRTEDGHEGLEDVIIQRGGEQENNVYHALSGLPGFQLCIGCFVQDGIHYLVLRATGPSIKDLSHVYSKASLSLKTVLILMDQLIERLQALHSQGFVHGGIRPSNIALSLPEGGPIHLTGLGCPKRYRGDNQDSLYASINPNLSPCSDLESLGYVMLRFLRGDLPWENLPKGDIIQKKRELPQNLSDWPQLAKYLRHLCNLGNDEPDYSSLRELFSYQFGVAGFVSNNVYDWARWRLEMATLKGYNNRNSYITEIKNRLASGVEGQDRVQCLTDMLKMYSCFPRELQAHIYIERHKEHLEMVENAIEGLKDNCIRPILEASDIPLSITWSAHAIVCEYALAWPMFEEELDKLRERIVQVAKNCTDRLEIWVDSARLQTKREVSS
ncbi:MAG: Casein kinase I isoform delta [Trichoglossum hirsutum]|nr:MAG: Casein kinase I isoform delta [Trichoglossum hirsutum]